MITQTLFAVKKLKYERENLSTKGQDGWTKHDRTSLESNSHAQNEDISGQERKAPTSIIIITFSPRLLPYETVACPMPTIMYSTSFFTM